MENPLAVPSRLTLTARRSHVYSADFVDAIRFGASWFARTQRRNRPAIPPRRAGSTDRRSEWIAANSHIDRNPEPLSPPRRVRAGRQSARLWHVPTRCPARAGQTLPATRTPSFPCLFHETDLRRPIRFATAATKFHRESG